MHKDNTLYDEGIYDSCLLKLRKNVRDKIKIAIKFHGTDHELAEIESLSHRCEIISLKKELESIVKLSACQIVLLDCRENVLDSEKSLADYGVYKSCSLFFKPHFQMGVKSSSNILTRDVTGKLDYSIVHRIDRNTQIISMDIKQNRKVASKGEIIPVRSRVYNQVELEDGLSIGFVGSCYFYALEKGWMIVE